MHALGLDISTSIIGWSVLPLDAKLGDLPLRMDHIDLRKVKGGYWDKVDTTKLQVDILLARLASEDIDVKQLFVEDPVKRFKSGGSSADTIGLLAKFNCMVSYFARQRLGIDPIYLDATVARRGLGIELTSKKKSNGMNQKEQTFRQLSETVFKGMMWPLNRNDNLQPYCYDRVDSYVICMAGVVGVR